MEAGQLTEPAPHAIGERFAERLRQTPGLGLLLAMLVIALILIATDGLHEVAQKGVNGLAYGAIYALGAVGLTLVYGILKLVNFAHADFLTFGAYMAFVVNITIGAPLVLAIAFAMVMTAVLGVALEKVMWAPMRRRRAGMLQLLLMTIGLALLIRYTIQFGWGTELRQLDVDRSSSVEFLGLRMGRMLLIVLIVGVVTLSGIGLMLRYTLLGKRMRALSDNLELAETAGIDTRNVIFWVWVVAGASAGLAGVLAGSVIQLQPELAFELLLPIFAAAVLGGIGNPFGALAGGMVLGIVIEWATLVIAPGFKQAVGFIVLILVLILRPQGIMGQARQL